MTAENRISQPMSQPYEDFMLDGRYDPAFALYFTQQGDTIDLPPVSGGWVIFCLASFAAISGTLAFLAL